MHRSNCDVYFTAFHLLDFCSNQINDFCLNYENWQMFSPKLQHGWKCLKVR